MFPSADPEKAAAAAAEERAALLEKLTEQMKELVVDESEVNEKTCFYGRDFLYTIRDLEKVQSYLIVYSIPIDSGFFCRTVREGD